MTTDPAQLPLGGRVVLRYRLPVAAPEPFTDVIGELTGRDPVTVRTADGRSVTVAPEQIVALKAIGPRPIRTREIRALEHAAATAWPGSSHTWIDGWLVRAGSGYTQRANSAVPVGESGRPAQLSADTVQRIHAWYAERGLPLLLQLPDRLAPVPPGWDTRSETQVLGLDIDNVVLPAGPSMVRIAPEPDAAWLELHRTRGALGHTPLPDEAPGGRHRPRLSPPADARNAAVPGAPPADARSQGGTTDQGGAADAAFPARTTAPAPDVLTSVLDGETGFAALGVPERLAIGRGAVTTAPDGRRWIGLTCVAVAAAHRRNGLATLVCAELLRWGRERGATHAYVQVDVGNEAALDLYRHLGFLEHHSYRFASPPGPGGPSGAA